MVHKSWTDNEILEIIHSNAPDDIVQKAWDALVFKYQGELEEYALELWGGDDFLVSDTLDRALVTARVWITALDEIDAVNGNIRDWLRSIIRSQFYQDSIPACASPGNHEGSIADGGDWMEDEFASFEIELSSGKPFVDGRRADEPENPYLEHLSIRARHLIENM